MNVLYLSIGEFDNIEAGSVHIDIIRRISQEHNVYLVVKNERRNVKPTTVTEEFGMKVLRVRTGNIKNVSLLEKGISTLLIEGQFIRAIKKHFKGVKFDLVLYSTPPITFAKVVSFVKKRDNARSYLMLKDIFPQNAVDLGVLRKTGLKGLIYKFFRRKEKKLYKLSDNIGCMSEANVRYVIDNNPEVDKNKVEICPNSLTICDRSVDSQTRFLMREKYGLPQNKRIFIYGGNLGKPQGIDFLIKCLKVQDIEDAYFLIVGSGTEYGLLEKFILEEKPRNVKLMKYLLKQDYDNLVASCDVGMIFLDQRFTIPNFPARLLSYMQARLPIICCTDTSTDVGEVVSNGGFGWSCISRNVEDFLACVDQALKANLKDMGDKAYEYFCENYSVDRTYSIIMDKIKQ